MSENNNQNNENLGQEFADKAKEIINDVEDNTSEFTSIEIESGKLMGIFSYILAPIPFILEKENKFARYHAKQGMTLFIIGVVCAVIISILEAILGSIIGWIINIVGAIIGVVYVLLCVIGIINVLQSKAKKLPVIGNLNFFA